MKKDAYKLLTPVASILAAATSVAAFVDKAAGSGSKLLTATTEGTEGEVPSLEGGGTREGVDEMEQQIKQHLIPLLMDQHVQHRLRRWLRQRP